MDLPLQKTSADYVAQSLKPHSSQYKYPQKQVNQYAVAFEGNVKSFNTKTGRITTHKYKGKEA